MNSKMIMASSAVLMSGAGILCSFLPQEIAAALFGSSDPMTHLFIQITGALYFAFGMLNWTAKENLIGGIYNRPIAVGNLTHFVVGALALVKGLTGHSVTVPLTAVTVIYTVFAVAFGMLFFRHPAGEGS